MSEHKERLFGMTLSELQNVAQTLSFPKFVAKQIADWLYKKGIDSIEQMSNISQKNRNLLSQSYEVGKVKPASEWISIDGTKKYLFEVGQKNAIESVYIPEDDRATLCVSCQVGCKMNCEFCMTGKQGFSANLTTNEILNQIASIPDSQKLTNVVYMGMGEPMDNIDAVLKSLEILTSEWGYAWSPKRITVSTVGLKKGLGRFLAESKCHLAVSLHNPFPQQRKEFMPAEKAWSIVDVIEEIKKFDFFGQRRVSFEYTMFKGWNDSDKHASALAELLKGLECRVNLIRFHSIPGAKIEGISNEAMVAFRDKLNNKGITATIRRSRGEDIFGACGMLSSNN